jgi:hypothetical protein
MLFMWISAVPVLSWFEQSAAHQQLEDASFRWHHERIEHYSFEFDAFGNTAYEFRLPIRIKVQNGEFLAAYDIDTASPVDIASARDVPTSIEAAFAMISDLLEQRPYAIDVQYDSIYAYPSRIQVRHSEAEGDIETFYLRAFRPE